MYFFEDPEPNGEVEHAGFDDGVELPDLTC